MNTLIDIYHVRGIVSRVSQRLEILGLVKRVHVDTSVLLRCYYMHLFSQSLSIIHRCGGLLLNVIFRYSSARRIRWPGFALIRLSCLCVIDVLLLHCECCTMLIRTRIIVCSVSFHLPLSEFDIPELRLLLIH